MTDIRSCYNRQLLNIGRIIEELVSKNRQVMKLFRKVMLLCYYYICIGYGISAIYYRGIIQQLARTRQGNKFSGNMYRNKSYFIIGEIEKKDL